MSQQRHEMHVEALAARGLMLQPGRSFGIEVPKRGATDAEDLAEKIEDALESQYRAGIELVPGLATPDEIDLAVLRFEERDCVIVGRPGCDDDPCSDCAGEGTCDGCA